MNLTVVAGSSQTGYPLAAVVDLFQTQIVEVVAVHPYCQRESWFEGLVLYFAAGCSLLDYRIVHPPVVEAAAAAVVHLDVQTMSRVVDLCSVVEY